MPAVFTSEIGAQTTRGIFEHRGHELRGSMIMCPRRGASLVGIHCNPDEPDGQTPGLQSGVRSRPEVRCESPLGAACSRGDVFLVDGHAHFLTWVTSPAASAQLELVVGRGQFLPFMVRSPTPRSPYPDPGSRAPSLCARVRFIVIGLIDSVDLTRPVVLDFSSF